MTDLFGNVTPPEIEKEIFGKPKKEKKPETWDIYRVTENEERYYSLYCAKSHGHAKMLYCNYLGIDFMDADVSINKLGFFKKFIRDVDKCESIEVCGDNIYWTDCFFEVGGYYEYDDKKISVEEIKELEIDYEFISVIFPKK